MQFTLDAQHTHLVHVPVDGPRLDSLAGEGLHQGLHSGPSRGEDNGLTFGGRQNKK